MKSAPRASSHKSQSGVILLEGLVAILIFTVGIIGLMGLQAAMVKHTTDARYRIEASNIAQRRLSDIWTTATANRGNLSETNTDISVASGLPGGKRDTIRGPADNGCNNDPTCYVVRVKWTLPGETIEHNYLIISFIQ
jgi:type IV pilus assembly protein PilV